MAITDRSSGGVLDVAIIPACSDTAAPTVAEITAGTRLETYLVGGLKFPRSANSADVSSVADRESFNISTSIQNGDITGTFWREFDGTDAAWAALDDTADPVVTQYLVVCSGGFTSSKPTAADIVDVYTIHVATREAEPGGKDDPQRFNSTMTVLGTAFDGAVAA